MVKFLKPNKAVIILQGRYAGRKAVIVKHFDDGTRDRPYGHCLVAGIKKYPSKVIKKDSTKKTAKKSRVKCFIKLVNYQHLMPTRYTLDVDLKDAVTAESLTTKDKKVTACKDTKAKFEERFKTGKNRWFFTKLSKEAVDYLEAGMSSPLPAARSGQCSSGGRLTALMLSSSETHQDFSCRTKLKDL
ncbi:60S ribosomal protein L27-like [Populus alba x Populus x berolinensis]|uniref:60S ribosomal protein L27-like n=1 Tax=Populus alba x Populus x berolinensis TaxID=444605 RepID=A0AAD6LKH7_9ROSI|nr:60S ribosomal protein L27-like [Populus alba x Populus x berolinensis]